MGQLAIKSGAPLPFRAARDRFSLAYLQPVPTAWWGHLCRPGSPPATRACIHLASFGVPASKMAPSPPLPPCCQLCPHCSSSPARGPRGGRRCGRIPAAPRVPPPPGSSLPRRSRVLPGRGHGGSGGAHPVSPLGVPPPVPGCSPREPPGGAFRPRPVPQAHPAAPGAAGDPSAPSAPSASCCSLEHPSAPRAPNVPAGPSASCCPRGSLCSRCIPVLPVHLSPSRWSLVLPSQGCW